MRGLFGLLHSPVRQSRQRIYLIPSVFAKLTEQHQTVMEAIQAVNADGAREAMMAHLEFVHATMKRFDQDQIRLEQTARLPGNHNESISGENKR